MVCMRAVGSDHGRPAHARVREETGEYVIELDVADVTECELAVEIVARRSCSRSPAAFEWL
jgi:hypothetical protein